jgi:hypothetical protein
MRVKVVKIPFTKASKIKIYCIGDIHGGTQHCMESLLKKTISKVKNDPEAYWVDMGDKCEFIGTHDKRWDSGGLELWVKPKNIGISQAEWYMDLMTPIKDKCIGLIEGNHEDTWTKQTDTDIHEYICSKLGLTNLSYACFIRFQFSRKASPSNRYSYDAFFTHGAGGAITAGAKIMRLQRLMDSWDADMVAQGHVHELLTYHRPYMKLDHNNEVKNRVKAGALTGCYFRTYTQDVASSYGERKNYPPVMLGSPVFVIEPFKNILRVENG